MKKLITVSLLLFLAIGVNAQKFRGRVIHAHPRTRVSVGVGFGGPLYYSPYWYGPWYGPWYASPYWYYPPYRESRLELRIEEIKNDYQDKIWSARHDKSLSRAERKKQVHELKHERDQEIIKARQDYYKRS